MESILATQCKRPQNNKIFNGFRIILNLYVKPKIPHISSFRYVKSHKLIKQN